jgi:ribosomally synthesized peptide (two-chain TOMM family)
MGMDKLMQFRTIYLRAVAEAWANPDFHKQLLEHPVHALRDFFGFKWPWSHICNLKIDESNRFMWIGNEWVWAPCQGESLTLFVPLEPRGIEPKHRAMALGDFYRQSSSIFSDDWGQPFGPDGPSAPGTASASAPSGAAGLLGGALGPDSGPPPGGFVPGSAVFASFDVVLLAAMARAWEDSDYRTKLLLDTATALHEIREYALPWKLLIRIEDDPHAKWTPPHDHSKQPAKHQSFWSHGKHNALRLLLPEKPRDIAVEPLALASYNAMGAQYPFTCCCFDD